VLEASGVVVVVGVVGVADVMPMFHAAKNSGCVTCQERDENDPVNRMAP
jgi:hypothetical protein